MRRDLVDLRKAAVQVGRQHGGRAHQLALRHVGRDAERPRLKPQKPRKVARRAQRGAGGLHHLQNKAGQQQRVHELRDRAALAPGHAAGAALGRHGGLAQERLGGRAVRLCGQQVGDFPVAQGDVV